MAVFIAVHGAGYLGATHAACLADAGHRVVAVDVDPERVASLRAGRVPFHEPGLAEVVERTVAAGTLHATDDAAETAGAAVHFLCVGTPSGPDGVTADLSALWAAVDALAPHLCEPTLVVGRSTVPVGTAPEVARRLRATAPAGARVHLAWNPEFLREGRAVADTRRPDRMVLGVESDHADEDCATMRAVHGQQLAQGVPLLVTDLATAELAKVSANVMLAARVSLVNVLAEVCEAADADVSDLTTILGHDPRIGAEFLQPGLGYGGGCLPKDTRAFVARARQLGVTGSAQLVSEVDHVNRHQRDRAAQLATALLDEQVAGARVGVLGAAFKAGTDDVRESPALDVAARLLAAGAVVRVHDPRAGHLVTKALPEAEVALTIEDACAGADLLLVLTAWAEYEHLDPEHIGALVRQRRLLDARLVVDPAAWTAAGWTVRALGRSAA